MSTTEMPIKAETGWKRSDSNLRSEPDKPRSQTLSEKCSRILTGEGNLPKFPLRIWKEIGVLWIRRFDKNFPVALHLYSGGKLPFLKLSLGLWLNNTVYKTRQQGMRQVRMHKVILRGLYTYLSPFERTATHLHLCMATWVFRKQAITRVPSRGRYRKEMGEFVRRWEFLRSASDWKGKVLCLVWLWSGHVYPDPPSYLTDSHTSRSGASLTVEKRPGFVITGGHRSIQNKATKVKTSLALSQPPV